MFAIMSSYLLTICAVCCLVSSAVAQNVRQVDNVALPRNAKTTTGCGGILTDQTGVFTSPDYPNSYGTNVACQWLIQLQSHQRVFLVFHNFSTEFYYDRVTIYDGSDSTAPVLLELSGYAPTPLTLTSSTNQVFVKLTSDSIGPYSGFLASYRPDVFDRFDCDQALTDPSGWILSPNFENTYYPNSVQCQWIINVEGSSGIRIDFSMFSTQPGRDILTIEDPFSSSPVLLSHSGTEVPESIVSTSNRLIVRFVSDSSINYYRGFQLQYSAMLSE